MVGKALPHHSEDGVENLEKSRLCGEGSLRLADCGISHSDKRLFLSRTVVSPVVGNGGGSSCTGSDLFPPSSSSRGDEIE